jgi:capsid protein
VLFHVYDPKRMSQTRGVTAFAPIFALSGMFEDIQFAKLVQQQVVSCFAIFRQRDYIADLPGPGVNTSGNGSALEVGSRQIDQLVPGLEFMGAPGETLSGFSPNTPNAEYFSHVRLMLQMIGVNLGLPLCLVLMDGSETNFSGWRGAVDEARKGFRSRQKNLVKRFHRPVYKFQVRRWMAEDRTLRIAAKKQGVNIFGHTWNPPSWAYIDPVGDATGDILRLQNNLTSPRRLHAERGRDVEKINKESIEDNARAISEAKTTAASLNQKFPNDPPVQWRELINLPLPGGAQLTLADPNQIAVQKMQAEQKVEATSV